jgi:hypothetical protein
MAASTRMVPQIQKTKKRAVQQRHHGSDNGCRAAVVESYKVKFTEHLNSFKMKILF